MKIKKILSLALSALMLLSLSACKKEKKEGIFDSFAEPAKNYAQISLELNEAVKNNYWVEEAQFAFHYYPNGSEDMAKRDTAFAWPYTEMVAANWRVATLSGGAKERIEDFYRSTLSGFEYYRSLNRNYHCYVASRATAIGMAGGDTYYDDNIWISREFLNAYEVLGGGDFLKTAVAVAEYVYSGWANDELGGIYWCEQKKDSRNTCSNAPAVILFARLYETTNDQKWLDRARQVYEWTYTKLRDPSDDVYWDNISNEGNINKWKFTYNTGSMIEAGVKLYEITKEESYLSQAKASAAGAYEHWFKDNKDFDFKTIDSVNPWFNVLLLSAWVELYPFDKETTAEYIETYEKNLVHAYSLRDEESGFMPADWVKGFNKDDNGANKVYGLNILDMAANSENFGTLAYYYQFVKGEV